MKLNMKRPQIWYACKNDPILNYNDDRIRVLYPDGRAEFAFIDSARTQQPCWFKKLRKFKYARPSIKEMLKAMKSYDETWDIKSVFIGYL